MSEPAESTKQRALDALDGMAQIAKNEMLIPGEYLSARVAKPALAERGSVCRGHHACLIGSLWLGYGIKPMADGWGGFHLPGAEGEVEHAEYVAHRPGLKLAFGALNDAAARWTARLSPHHQGRVRRMAKLIDAQPAEALFEGLKMRDRREQLKLINAAKRIVRAA